MIEIKIIQKMYLKIGQFFEEIKEFIKNFPVGIFGHFFLHGYRICK